MSEEDETPHAASSSPAGSASSRRLLCSRSLLGVIVGGQLLALLITGSGVFSQLLADRGVNIPTSQSGANYLLLACFMIPRFKRWYQQRRERQLALRHLGPDGWAEVSDEDATSPQQPQPAVGADGVVVVEPYLAAAAPSSRESSSLLAVAWWKYLLLAACDVEGNFLLVKAYQYTTITSVQLLDCFTIPVVMLLSFLFMRVKYTRKHLLGAFICLVGLSLLITSDLLSGRNSDADSGAHDRVLGDMLVLIGCFFYAISNIGQEYLVKTFDRFEFLGMLGCFGSLISAVQIAVLERDALSKVDFGEPVVCLYLLGFTSCLFSLYYFTPLLLVHSSALFMNLSFLTSDFWSILFAVSLFHAQLNLLYFVAFAIIIVGLLVYNLAGLNVSLLDLLRQLCDDQPPSEEHQSIEPIDPEPPSSSLPTTHAHTRPAPRSAEEETHPHERDRDPMLGIQHLQQADREDAPHHHH